MGHDQVDLFLPGCRAGADQFDMARIGDQDEFGAPPGVQHGLGKALPQRRRRDPVLIAIDADLQACPRLKPG